MSKNFGRLFRQLARRIVEQLAQSREQQAPRTQSRTPSGKVPFPFGTKSDPTGPLDPATAPAAGAHAAREYRMPPTGLPRLEYDPHQDGEADPGEVVWAWVPYEDVPTQGKDRPVLIISRVTGGYLGLQMTSKDHARNGSGEDQYGRHWIDIGSGPWDSQRRDSEVRLDRLLFIPPQGVRREGATLPKDRYLQVARALRELHG